MLRKIFLVSRNLLLIASSVPATMYGQASNQQQLQQQLLQLQMRSAGSPMGSAQGGPGNTMRSGAVVAPEDVSKLKLAPGSMIEVHVFEEPDLDGTYRLDTTGQVKLPLAGDVLVKEMTLREAEVAIRTRLVSEEILKDPHVVVNVAEYSTQNIVVLGEVGAPGRYPVIGSRTLLDVLAMAGGQTAMAGNEILVHRDGTPADKIEKIHFSRRNDDPTALASTINPGDTLVIRKAGIVYVLGSVNRPGGYVMQEAGDLTVNQAIALALGTAPGADTGKVRVVRKNADGSMSEIRAQYDEANKGQVFPFELQPEDVVYVPANWLKTTFLNTRQFMGQVASATIYAVQ
ncbi:polysaccharide export protein [Candidatus Koribacter versatilis Ellin345]|uniref:Polysaccharide export protein n=1 Tax=Koribacter versatilis (strain Ellin345) TaxID=204669 RepID=Q1IJZ7_KORVE|nr:polysaccharide biosynthesis/export family protein [Candidatus Koribacter versatilis]ABF42803.1 polysaccharide export protein [Candidatus Koribacter versatilis Ellin345]